MLIHSAGVAAKPQSPWLAGLALTALIATAYIPVTQAGFVWDDDQHLAHNVALRTVSGLGRVWFDIDATPQYYPLVHTSFWLEYQLWGDHPLGYHLVNVLLHAMVSVLAWRLLLALGVPGAWLVAAVFALHPVQVESVAWVTERKNVLSGVFYFASAIMYLSAVGLDQQKPNLPYSNRRYLASLAFFGCALLSKTVTATLPAALLVLVWWKRGRIRAADTKPLGPFFALGIVLGFLTLWIEKNQVGARGGAWDLSALERILVAGRALWFYAAKLAWPADLSFIYSRWNVSQASWWQYVYPSAAILLMLALFCARHRIGRGPIAAVCLFAGTLFPALGFFDVYPMRYAYVANHFSYIAGLGIMALLIGPAWRLAVDHGPSAVLPTRVAACTLLAVLVAFTWQQAATFRDSKTLWLATLDNNPDAWIAHNNLARLLEADNRLSEALRHDRQAVKSPTNPAINVATSHYNIGNILTKQGRLPEAIESYRRSVVALPTFAEAYHNLGNAWARSGRWEKAVDAFEHSVRAYPKRIEAHLSLGQMLLRSGRSEEGIQRLHIGLALEPRNGQLRFRVGSVLLQMGETKPALKLLREGVRLEPRDVKSAAKLAWLLATLPDANLRDPTEAMAIADRAARQTRRKDFAVLDALAAGYAAAGRFDEAIATADEAMALAKATGITYQTTTIQHRLTLYRQRKPYTEDPR